MTASIALEEEFTPYLAPVFNRKPISVIAMDVTGMTSYTDMVVIVEAGSKRQVTSIADHVVKTLKKLEKKALGIEGVKEGEWALLDYGHIVIHVFDSEARAFYDLEGLWCDAPRVDLSSMGPVSTDPQEDQTEEDFGDFDDGF